MHAHQVAPIPPPSCVLLGDTALVLLETVLIAQLVSSVQLLA